MITVPSYRQAQFTPTLVANMPRQATLVAVLLASAVNAHFSIKFPEQNSPSDENSLDEGPCGGASLDFSSKTVTDFHVGGDAIALTPTHPQANWLFRATTDTKGEGNWTQIFPIFQQGGLGELCQPDVSVPEDFAGKQGLISVVANAEDGVLYGVSISYVAWLIPHYMLIKRHLAVLSGQIRRGQGRQPTQ